MGDRGGHSGVFRRNRSSALADLPQTADPRPEAARPHYDAVALRYLGTWARDLSVLWNAARGRRESPARQHLLARIGRLVLPDLPGASRMGTSGQIQSAIPTQARGWR